MMKNQDGTYFMVMVSPAFLPSGTITWHLATPPFFGLRGKFSSVIFPISSTHFLYNLSAFRFKLNDSFFASLILILSSDLIFGAEDLGVEDFFPFSLFFESLFFDSLDSLDFGVDFDFFEASLVDASFLGLALVFFLSDESSFFMSSTLAFFDTFLSLGVDFAFEPSLRDLFLFFLQENARKTQIGVSKRKVGDG